ncbi:MAG TPA: CopG family transcriptional regulator [Gemmatimonadales bacterium]|nr:CopG family transcriptional regulator [Gemmatimonadales bacterium]
MTRRRAGRVREPVQVYLDQRDLATLNAMARSTGLSKAELLRRGLRKLAGEELGERAPGWSLDVLIGSIPQAPPDLSARVDDYLYGAGE